MVKQITLLPGMAGLIDRYDAFIIDIWGVVHDGIRPYPGAVACLKRMRQAGGTVLLLSNVPRPSDAVRTMLAETGVAEDCYDDILTSGDATREALARRDDPWYAALGRRCFFIGTAEHRPVIDGLGYELVGDVAAADFILAASPFDGVNETVASYEGLLAEALGRGLPMICVNPDLTMMHGEQVVLCSGSLAQAYAARGGDVRYHGKPHAEVYRVCLQRLGGMAPSRILAIGDTPRTDLAGAQAAGMDAVLVAGGIHADEFTGSDGEIDPHRVSEVCRRAGTTPTAVVPRLCL